MVPRAHDAHGVRSIDAEGLLKQGWLKQALEDEENKVRHVCFPDNSNLPLWPCDPLQRAPASYSEVPAAGTPAKGGCLCQARPVM